MRFLRLFVCGLSVMLTLAAGMARNADAGRAKSAPPQPQLTTLAPEAHGGNDQNFDVEDDDLGLHARIRTAPPWCAGLHPTSLPLAVERSRPSPVTVRGCASLVGTIELRI